MPLSPEDFAKAVALIDDGFSLRYAAATLGSPFTTVQENAVNMSEDFVDSVLRCGLYLGAVFQLICIAAAIVMPDKVGDSSISYCKDLDVSEDEGSDHSTPQATPRRPHTHHRPRKQEKKKRR